MLHWINWIVLLSLEPLVGELKYASVVWSAAGAQLSMKKVPRILDVVGDAAEGPVQLNKLSTYEEILVSEREHSACCSAARARRLEDRYKGNDFYVHFELTEKQIYRWFRAKDERDKRLISQ
jgi:hypothetical protein